MEAQRESSVDEATPLRGVVKELEQRVAEQTACFVACEPRRYPVALRATRWLRLIGCNWITRHDARASVRAGFNGQELSRLWPRGGDWQWQEKAAEEARVHITWPGLIVMLGCLLIIAAPIIFSLINGGE